MTDQTREISLNQLILALSDAIDLVSPELTGHHSRVAILAAEIARAVGMPAQDQIHLAVAGLLHDAGALSRRDRLQLAEFAFDVEAALDDHEYMGYVLLRRFDPLASVAGLIRHHHLRWDRRGECDASPDTALAANLLFLADRIDTLIVGSDRDTPVLVHVDGIVERIARESGVMFAPEFVDALRGLSKRPSFWLDVVTSRRTIRLDQLLGHCERLLGPGEVESISMVFSGIIDFRSRFTATHSAGVSATAARLAALAGFDTDDTAAMALAGRLHDIGKLAVPTEILEKPGALDAAEIAVIRTHTYHSYRVLDGIDGLETINEWASFHHERLDGAGYPFTRGGDELSTGSRVMAVADVLTAITEDRPYRAGMDRSKAVSVLESMAAQGALDGELVALARDEYDVLNDSRTRAQRVALEQFESFAEETRGC